LVGSILLIPLYLLGLGWLLNLVLFDKKWKELSTDERPQFLGNLLVGGLIINFSIILIFQNLSVSIVIGGILSIVGICDFLVKNTNKVHHLVVKDSSHSKPGWYLFGLFMLLIYLTLVLTIPLIDWDARSIWFFHGKMIFLSNTIGLNAGWLHPSVQFSHVDYPKLIPAMAAQVASIMGFWNDYIPKLSLIFLLIPILFYLISLIHKDNFFLLLLFPLISLGKWMWNGYMDGYVALYFGMSIFYGYQFIKSRNIFFLISSINLLIMCLYLKNEGLLMFVAAIIGISIFYLAKNIKIKITERLLIYTGFLILPFLIWNFYKLRWGLNNDLSIGSNEFFQRIGQRLIDGSLAIIIRSVEDQIIFGVILFATFFTVLLYINHKNHFGSILIFIAVGFIYSIGIIVIYLSTPHDLSWHLSTSIERTMLPVNFLLGLGLVTLLKRIKLVIRYAAIEFISQK
jgi:hypothetical protein